MTENASKGFLAAWLGAIAVIFILFVADYAGAHSSDGPISVLDGQDAVISFVFDGGVAATTMDLTVTEYKDNNNDGEFLDAGETDIFISQQPVSGATGCTDADINPHISCSASTAVDSATTYVWRNATTRHVVGNYSFTMRWVDNLGGLISRSVIGIRITPDGVLASDITAARNTLLTSIDDHDANMTENGATIIFDDQDFISAGNLKTNDTIPGSSSFQIVLIRRIDNNADGDFADASESTTIVNAATTGTSCTAAALNPHFSCLHDFTTGQYDLVWRNASTSHIPGNYSLNIQVINGASVPLRENTFGIRILPTGVWGRTIVDEEANLTLLINNANATSVTQRFNLNNNLSFHDTNTTVRIEGAEGNLSTQHTEQNRNASGRMDWYVTGSNQDVYLVWDNPTITDAARFDFSITEYDDSNGDGQFIGAAEIQSLLSVTDVTTCLNLAVSHIACTLVDLASGKLTLSWKQTSSLHQIGNFTLVWQIETSGGTVRHHREYGVRIADPPLGGSQTTNEIITNPPNALNDQIARVAIGMMLLALMAVFATRPGFVLPAVAIFGSVVLFGVYITNGDMFTSHVVTTIMTMSPGLPMIIGAFNLHKTRRGGAT